MKSSILWMLPLLTVVSALAGTHVNISISQEHPKHDAHIKETARGDQVQLKSDSIEQFQSGEEYVGDHSGRSARIEVNDKDGQNVQYANHKAEGSATNSDVMFDGNFDRMPHYHHMGMHNNNPIEYQRNGQFRKMNDQQTQNMEFERYIQHYHSGPTVETVFESSDAAPPHSAPSRVNEGSQAQRSARIMQFERQVALPAPASAAASESEQQIHQHQPSLVQETSSSGLVKSGTSAATSSSSSSTVPGAGISLSAGSGIGFKINVNQRPASVGSDGLNFDQSTSFNKPNYNEPGHKFKYNNDDSDIHFHNQYPPSVEEPHGGYGGYFQPNYGNSYGHHPGGHGHNYLPPDSMNQRPVVTKTIQIAQPAIKTKKYEVRHPAIQKEFYDIEERVLIKPAGTVVVELERPVAKIPKGESILPLGHPHPAVAGAYMNNGNSPAFSNIIYSAAGGSSQTQQNNQYNPSPAYNTRHVAGSGSTVASTITSTPSFDQNSKELAVEANLNKQYSGENHFTATPSPADESKSKSREVIVVTDGQGNQRQVSPDQFSYSRDETDKGPSRSVYNVRSYSNHNNVAPQRSNYQPQHHSNRNDFAYEAEYISTGNNNIPRDSKPARLEEAPMRMPERQQQPVIKHEHNIHLAPSQHKIYLTRTTDVPQSRYVGESANVQEVKPYVQNHRGPVVVYASSKPRSEVTFRQNGEYRPQSQVVQYHSSAGGSSRPEISAPYAQMRYHSDGQARQVYSTNERENQKFGKLILEENTEKEMKSKVTNNSTAEAQTSIEINIPQASQGSHKPIVVSSTIRPMMSIDGDNMHNSKLEISITNNGEPKEEQQMNTSNEHSAETKEVPDCDRKMTMTQHQEKEQKFMRIVEASGDSSSKESTSAAEPAVSNIAASNVDINLKGSSGHVAPQGSRVIAATPAPTDSSSGSESFHKRRIVVNHPFQTVREVVEHEPYTNYHEVQVNEPASPALYHSAAYYQTHGAMRQRNREGRVDHHQAASTNYH